MTARGVALAVALSARRRLVTERCLTMLAGWADERGVAWVLEQVEDDPGLLWLPNGDAAWMFYPAFGAPVKPSPRCGVVKASTVSKYGRLDARFYLGGTDGPARVARAVTAEREATRRRRRAERDAEAEAERLGAMVDSGEVRLLT